MWFSLDLQVQFQFNSTQNTHPKINSTHNPLLSLKLDPKKVMGSDLS